MKARAGVEFAIGEYVRAANMGTGYVLTLKHEGLAALKPTAAVVLDRPSHHAPSHVVTVPLADVHHGEYVWRDSD